MLKVLLLNNTNSKIPFKMFLLDLQIRGKWLAYNMHAKSLYHSKSGLAADRPLVMSCLY